MDEDAFRKMIPILQKYNYHISIHTTKGKYILTDFESYWDLHVKLLMKGRGRYFRRPSKYDIL